MSKLVPAHDISNCYQCIEYKSMPGTDDQLMYCRKIKRKTNSSSIINNESISSNTITQFDEKWLDLISIPDKKSVYDYINVNQEIIDVLEKIVNKAKFFDISPSDLILWKRKDREDDSFEYLLLIITFHENFMKKHLDIINELTNIIANKMNQMSSKLVISAKYST